MYRKHVQNLWLSITEVCFLLLPLAGIWWNPFADEACGQNGELWESWIAVLVFLNLAAWTVSYISAYRSRREVDASVRIRILLLIPVLEYASLLCVPSGLYWHNFSASSLTAIFIGLMLIVIGNLLPKIAQNSYIGIRTPWALKNRENWNRTARISGLLWVAGGLLCWLSVLLQVSFWFSFILILTVSLLPVLISWLIYRQQLKDGTWYEDSTEQISSSVTKKGNRLAVIITAAGIFLAIVLIAEGRNYSVRAQEQALEIHSTLAGSMSIPYESIESLVLKKAEDPGSKVLGYSAFGIDLGRYQNSLYGNYSRYTANSPEVIEIRQNGQIVVVSLADQPSTERLFQEIKQKLSQMNISVQTVWLCPYNIRKSLSDISAQQKKAEEIPSENFFRFRICRK